MIKFIRLINNFGLFFLLITCKSSNLKNNQLVLASSSESIAVFALQTDDFSSILPQKLAGSATKIDQRVELSKYLSLISFKKNLLSSENWEPLFSTDELKEMHLLLEKAIQQDSAFGYLVLLKRDDPLSPLLKILRSSFLIIKTEDGFIFSIPDLNQNLTFPSQYKFDDWALYNIPKIRSSKKQEIKLTPNKLEFSIYHELVNEDHRFYDRILIIGDKRFLPVPLLFRTPDLDEVEFKAEKQSVKDRLKTLENLRLEKMITEEEYKNKKSEILKDL